VSDMTPYKDIYPNGISVGSNPNGSSREGASTKNRSLGLLYG
jgi:hypothetical protein